MKWIARLSLILVAAWFIMHTFIMMMPDGNVRFGCQGPDHHVVFGQCYANGVYKRICLDDPFMCALGFHRIGLDNYGSIFESLTK